MIITMKVNNVTDVSSINGSLSIWEIMREIHDSFNREDVVCHVWHVFPHELEVRGFSRRNGKPFKVGIKLPKTYKDQPVWGHTAMPSYTKVL